MTFSKFAFAGLAAVLLAGSAVAATAPTTPPAQGEMGGGRGMMRGFFSPEERMMLFVDSWKATAAMNDDQKRDYRRQQRERIMAMSDADRAKLKADLDARWAALPDAQKATIKAKVQAFMAQRRAQGGYGQ
ncbi:MAG: hypothetical protein JO348_15950 [Alphaproteobacteria bacterium]|nr:hypothetical protein [Alphaproteobacteria bacterium]